MCCTKETELRAWDDVKVLFAGLRSLKRIVQSHLSNGLLFRDYPFTFAYCQE